MTLPDFESAVLDRIFLCWKDIATANTVKAYRLPPSHSFDINSFPNVMTIPAPMNQPIPAIASGLITVSRNYISRLFICPWPQGDDPSDTGSQPYLKAILWINIVRNYFLDKPRLQTSSLPALQYMFQDLQFTDSAVIDRPDPGGVKCAAIDFTLATSMRAPLSPSRIS